MEAPPSASGSTCQVVLEDVWDALLVISRSWTHIPGWPWAVLLGTVLLLFLLKRRLPPRSEKALGQRCSACPEVCGAGHQDMGPTTQAQDAHGSPGVVASPPSLQILCLAAMNQKLSRLVLWDPVDVLKKNQRSQPPQRPQVTGENPIIRTPEKDREQLGMKRLRDYSDNTPFPEPPGLLNQQGSRWRQRRQEKEEEERLELVPKHQTHQSPSRARPGLQAGPPPDLPAGDADAGTCGVPQKSGARNGDHPTRRAALDPQAVTEDAGFPVSPPSPEADPQDRATCLEAERQEIAELAQHIHRLHTREAALQRENAQLDCEIQQLRRSLQKPLDKQDEHALRLHGVLCRGATQRETMQKKLAGLYGQLEFTCQLRNLHKEMGLPIISDK